MKRFYYGAMATGLLFAACSSDNLSEPSKDNGPAEADKTIYVKMNIHGDMADGTRAGNTGDPEDNNTDFDPGDGESAVNNAYFVFYDANGVQVGDIVQINLNSATTGTETGTVEKYYQNVVPVSIKKGELDPAQVICYINPLTPAALQNPLATIQTVTRKEVSSKVDGTPAQGTEGEVGYVPEVPAKTYFPMSNSVYYPNNTASAPQIAVSVAKAQLYDTEAEARDAEAQAIDVYVERYASKLTFSVKEGATTTPYATATAEVGSAEIPVTLTWTPSKWALNAEANETYVVKSYRKVSKTGVLLTDNYTYAEANTALNGSLSDAQTWKWNNPDFHRSYWAACPAYFTEKYPEVAGDVEDYTLNQTYYSYNDVITGNKGFVQGSTPRYFRETTVGSNALDGGNPQAAVPSVIFVGGYTVSVNGTAAPANTSFYTYIAGSNGNPLVFFENAANSANSAVTGGVSMLKRFFQQTTVLYKDVNAGKTDAEGNALPKSYVALDPSNATDLATMVAALGIAYPSDAVLAASGTATEDMKVPARQRTLQFKEGANLNGIYVANGNGYKEIVADDAETYNSDTQIRFTAANRVLMQQVGFANFYNNGHAYYNIPVKHYGWYRPGNANRELKNGVIVDKATIDWSKVMVGDFGMVRNHSYSIEVNSIKGLATGIGGDKDPIVPPAETKDYYVAYKVRILKWAVVPQQNVDL